MRGEIRFHSAVRQNACGAGTDVTLLPREKHSAPRQFLFPVLFSGAWKGSRATVREAQLPFEQEEQPQPQPPPDRERRNLLNRYTHASASRTMTMAVCMTFLLKRNALPSYAFGQRPVVFHKGLFRTFRLPSRGGRLRENAIKNENHFQAFLFPSDFFLSIFETKPCFRLKYRKTMEGREFSGKSGIPQNSDEEERCGGLYVELSHMRVRGSCAFPRFAAEHGSVFDGPQKVQ